MKKSYITPITEEYRCIISQIMSNSQQGWSRDGQDVNNVYQEEDDTDEGGFMDLD